MTTPPLTPAQSALLHGIQSLREKGFELLALRLADVLRSQIARK